MYCYIFIENFTNGFKPESLEILSLIAILSGTLVIVSKNPIVSVLFLIGLFLSIASYLMLLGLNFIGLAYLLVYVGAVSILFLFILMLLNIRISELLSNTGNSIPLAILIGVACGYLIFPLLPSNFIPFKNYNLYSNNMCNDEVDFEGYYISELSNANITELEKGLVSFVTGKSWDGNL
jgi:NADH-ubiquinone oxidoreductase chain 6